MQGSGVSVLTCAEEDSCETAELSRSECQEVVDKLFTLLVSSDEGILTILATVESTCACIMPPYTHTHIHTHTHTHPLAAYAF